MAAETSRFHGRECRRRLCWCWCWVWRLWAVWELGRVRRFPSFLAPHSKLGLDFAAGNVTYGYSCPASTSFPVPGNCSPELNE